MQTSSPFSGSFKPTQRLSFMVDGANPTTTVAGSAGSRGDWTLRIDDVAPNATM
jgi:hypothetical protein